MVCLEDVNHDLFRSEPSFFLGFFCGNAIERKVRVLPNFITGDKLCGFLKVNQHFFCQKVDRTRVF